MAWCDAGDDFMPGAMIEDDDDFGPSAFDEPPEPLPEKAVAAPGAQTPQKAGTPTKRRLFASPKSGLGSATSASSAAVTLPTATVPAAPRTSAPGKRRRLWGKTAAPEGGRGASDGRDDGELVACADLWRQVVEKLRDEEENEGEVLERLAKGNHEDGRRKVEYLYFQKLRDEKHAGVLGAGSKPESRRLAREHFGTLNALAQLAFVLRATLKQDEDGQAKLVGYVLTRAPWREALGEAKACKGRNTWFHGQLLLATWHNDAWVLQRPGWAAVSTELDYWVEKLQEDKYVEKLWNGIFDQAVALTTKWGFQQMTICLELCPRTLAEKKVCRLHVHGGLRRRKK